MDYENISHALDNENKHALPKRLRRLVRSKKSNDDVQAELAGCLLENKWLVTSHLFSRYENVPLWQLLMNCKRTEVLEVLLHTFPEIAKGRNRRDQTLMHLVTSSPPLLKTLCLIYPTFVNKQDNKGNTPLHAAVINGALQSIKILLSTAPSALFIFNMKGKSVFQLAAENSDILNILFTQACTNKLTEEDPKRKALLDTIPFLSVKTTHDILPNTSITDNVLHHKNIVPEVDISQFSEQEQSELIESTLLPLQKNATHDSVKEALYRCFTKFSGIIPLQQMNNIESIFSGSALPIESKRQLLAHVSDKIIEQRHPIQTQQENLKQDFYLWLSSQDNRIHTVEVATPKFESKSRYISRQETMKLLWECFQQALNPHDIEHLMLGLSGRSSVRASVYCINRLYKHLNQYQQIMAQYMVYNLLQNDPYAFRDTALKCFNSFMQTCQEHAQNDPKSPSFYKKIKVINELEINDANTIAVDNFESLQQWCRLAKKEVSFENLLSKALKKPTDNRQKEVNSIAKELVAMSMCYYQPLPLAELAKNTETKKHRGQAFTNYFNNLSNLFVTSILSVETAKLPTALEILPQLANALCDLSEENSYADLTSLMIICACIHQHPIARLSNYWDKISEENTAIINELTLLCDNKDNYRHLRTLTATAKLSLPCSAVVHRDLRFAWDGNENGLQRLLMIGKVLAPIHQTQRQIQYQSISFCTDLPQTMERYKPKNEKVLDALSLIHKPKKPLGGSFSPRSSLTPRSIQRFLTRHRSSSAAIKSDSSDILQASKDESTSTSATDQKPCLSPH